jgi:hypothetical protein
MLHLSEYRLQRDRESFACAAKACAFFAQLLQTDAWHLPSSLTNVLTDARSVRWARVRLTGRHSPTPDHLHP